MAPTVQQSKNARAKQLAGGKAPKARVHRYLKSTEAKLTEGAKSTLLLKGIRCSQHMSTVLRDLRAMQAPHVKLLTKKNAIVPFDAQGQASLEFLTTKNDCTLFCMASHNKKRPNNLVLGRTFHHSLLDMMELGVLYFKSLSDYGGAVPKKRIGSKPLLLFQGNVWTQEDATMSKLQNLLIDFYRGDPVDKLVASGCRSCNRLFGGCRVAIEQQTNHSSTNVFCKAQKESQWDSDTTPALGTLWA